MARIKVRLMTTHLDRHNERFTLEALQCARKQIEREIIPQGIEHDPRIEPIGRILSAEIIKLEDGEYALEATNEIFDDFDKLEDINDKELVVHQYNSDSLEVRRDRSYSDKEDIEAINSIAELLKSSIPPTEEIKKALEPLSVLWIGGAFILGGISTGFLNKMGADAYDLLSKELSNLFSRKRTHDRERLLAFDFSIKGKKCNVEVIITNPTKEDIDYVLNAGFKYLDEILPLVFEIPTKKPLRKIVFESINKQLVFKFGVRKDGIPVKFKAHQKDQ